MILAPARACDATAASERDAVSSEDGPHPALKGLGQGGRMHLCIAASSIHGAGNHPGRSENQAPGARQGPLRGPALRVALLPDVDCHARNGQQLGQT